MTKRGRWTPTLEDRVAVHARVRKQVGCGVTLAGPDMKVDGLESRKVVPDDAGICQPRVKGVRRG